MRSSGGDESIPKFATFDDDGISATPNVKNTKKEFPQNGNLYTFPAFPSSGDVKTPNGQEQSRTEAWSTLKGLVGRSTSATNLFSRLTLNEDDDDVNETPMAHTLSKQQHRTPQDQRAISSSLATENGLSHTGKLFHENSNKKPRDGHKKSTTFVSSDDLDREAIILKQHYASKKCTFQNFSERMSVSVRVVDLSNRVAFARAQLPTRSQILAYADELIRKNGLKGENRDIVLAKLSPSPQYVDILNTWRRVSSIRQLCWSPSVSREADPFFGWSDDDTSETLKNEHNVKKSTTQNRLERRKHLTRRRRKNQAKRDGRYLQIDTMSYIKDTLPDCCPHLSYRKRRLPMRTDVGFDGATEQEIAIKEDEIRQEALLEEISPRIIVLLTSELISASSNMRKTDAIVHPDVLKLLNHSIPFIPFSGKDLFIAIQRNLKALGYSSQSKNTAGKVDTPHKTGLNYLMNQANASRASAAKVKPNPFSVFSPPLDASISSSQLWKPRPFFDRPSGFVHLLAVPVDVRFEVGDIEPLVCTLTLYSLPGVNNEGGSKYYNGKISEEFIFPAGNWSGLLSVDSEQVAKPEDSDMNNIHNSNSRSSEQLWRRRTNKALFSFNPTDLPPSSSDEFPSLYLVLQVYQILRKDALIPYLHDDSPRIGSMKGKLSMDASSASRKRFTSFESFDEKRHYIENDIISHFKTYGTQFLTPLCFGILPAFPGIVLDTVTRQMSSTSSKFSWPNGGSQIMQFFAYPTSPESHEEFIERLLLLSSHAKDQTSTAVGFFGTETWNDKHLSSDMIEEHDEGFEYFDKATSNRSTAPLKKRSTFIPFKRTKPQAEMICGNETICGKAFLFTSLVESDFSQVMLQQPPLFEQESKFLSSTPRLLVSVSGDGAIMAQPVSEDNIVKRSSLLRLPISGDPSGYVESSEIREILYLPLFLKKTDVASVITQRSFADTNLLYIYPKLIKQGTSHRTDVDRRQRDWPKAGNFTYALEVCLAQNGSLLLQNLYSTAPGQKPLVRSVYTKIPLPAGRDTSFDIRKGIHLRDEIKLKLPDILDESYSIVFTLHAVSLNNDNENKFLEVIKLADTFLPLCASSSIAGKPIVTIISDGVYHVDVGNVQVTFDIRVVSNIHASNPSIPAAINACPVSYEMKLFTKGIGSFCNQWSNLSGAVMNDNFYAWVYYFLSGCIALASNGTKIQSRSITSFLHRDLMLEIINALLILCSALKTNLLASDKEAETIEMVYKAFVDDFDDTTILYCLGDEAVNQSVATSSFKSTDLLADDDFDEKIAVDREESSTGKVRKTVKYSTDENILNRKSLNSTKQNRTFRRTAYGTSKSDRMRAEAAFHESSLMFSQLMDDEETIFTSGTWQTGGLRSSVNPLSTKQNMKADEPNKMKSHNIGVTTFSDQSALKNSPEHSDGRSARKTISMVNQVNNVAQTLIIPCISPAFSTGSPTSKSRQSKTNVINEKAQKLKINNPQLSVVASSHKEDELTTMVSGTYAPSSDIEDEKFFSKRNDTSDAFLPNNSVRLRGVGNWLTIFSSLSKSQETNLRPHVYEVVLILLRETWLEVKNGNDVRRLTFEAFIDNLDFLIPLCLKSLILRCSETSYPQNFIPSLLFDHSHVTILSSLVEATTFGLMDQIVKGNGQYGLDYALVKALPSNDLLIDFLTGLLTVIHPAQVSWLITKYFDCLRAYDTSSHEPLDARNIKPLLHLRGSRFLRLRAAEKMSSVPRFIALNFPLKTSPMRSQLGAAFLSWTKQIQMMPQHNSQSGSSDNMDSLRRLPENHWLAQLLVDECLTICARSCQYALAYDAVQELQSSTKKNESHLLLCTAIPCHQSIALHSITIVYELLLRSHATDRRYQNDEASYRVASLFLSPVVDNTIDKVADLDLMVADDKIRILWLSSVLYVLQESAETNLCNVIERIDIGSFCHVLRLCIETFDCFITANCLSSALTQDPKSVKISPWLAQESFNTISASIILLINESCRIINKPDERVRKAKLILDLLLYLLCIPQSPVTLLRVLGAVSHMIDKFGSSTVIDAMDDSSQNWARVIFTLMNNTSLSVRSMAVDLILSLFCSAYKKGCDFHQLILVFLSVLPEVVAREIGLHSVSGLIKGSRCIERCIWPIRRALADIEACDPIDDDRLDSALVPSLRNFTRSCQAIIDGVLIELRLKGNTVLVAGIKVSMTNETSNNWPLSWTFDADEESLLEAANSFDPETGCMQRLRWLLLLRLLHERKGNWIESGETLVLCALDISQSILHAKTCWLPSRFDLWYDSRLVALETKMNYNDWHTKLIEFFEPFLLNVETSTVPRPNIKSMCKLLTSVIKETVKKFEYEGNMEALALLRMEQLIKVVMNVIEDHAIHTSAPSLQTSLRAGSLNDEFLKSCTEALEENSALRQVSSALNEMVNKLSGKLFISSRKEDDPDHTVFYVQFLVCGFMPDRFKESTTIPTFNTFNVPHVCRVPKSIVSQVMSSDTIRKARASPHARSDFQLLLEESICREYAQVYIKALKDHSPDLDVVYSSDLPDENAPDFHSKTFISVRCLNSIPSSAGLVNDVFDRYLSARSGETRKFYLEKLKPTKSTVEITVPRKFPFVLSRQPILMSIEFISSIG